MMLEIYVRRGFDQKHLTEKTERAAREMCVRIW